MNRFWATIGITVIGILSVMAQAHAAGFGMVTATASLMPARSQAVVAPKKVENGTVNSAGIAHAPGSGLDSRGQYGIIQDFRSSLQGIHQVSIALNKQERTRKLLEATKDLPDEWEPLPGRSPVVDPVWQTNTSFDPITGRMFLGENRSISFPEIDAYNPASAAVYFGGVSPAIATRVQVGPVFDSGQVNGVPGQVMTAPQLIPPFQISPVVSARRSWL